MPNIGVEYDLSSSVYNKWTLGISATWNGNTDVNFDQKIQQRINDYRIEARKQREMLEDESYLAVAYPGQSILIEACRILPIDDDAARCGDIEAAYERHQRRFARA